VVQYLRVENFKNIANAELEFPSPVTWITGPNGAGKTSLLEAMAFFAYGKGQDVADENLCREGSHFFQIEVNDGNYPGKKYAVRYEKGKSVQYRSGGNPEKRSVFIRKFPYFLFSRKNEALFSSPGRQRRFFDHYFSQLDEKYLTELQSYQRILRKKKEALKLRSISVIEELNVLLARHGEFLMAFRAKTTTLLEDAGDGLWQAKYVPSTEEPLGKVFAKFLEVELGHKLVSPGPHRDSWAFSWKRRDSLVLSTGERRRFLNHIYLAAAGSFRQRRKLSLSLFLDDIFAELDKANTRTEFARFNELGEKLWITDPESAPAGSFLYRVTNGSFSRNGKDE